VIILDESTGGKTMRTLY